MSINGFRAPHDELDKPEAKPASKEASSVFRNQRQLLILDGNKFDEKPYSVVVARLVHPCTAQRSKQKPTATNRNRNSFTFFP